MLFDERALPQASVENNLKSPIENIKTENLSLMNSFLGRNWDIDILMSAADANFCRFRFVYKDYIKKNKNSTQKYVF